MLQIDKSLYGPIEPIRVSFKCTLHRIYALALALSSPLAPVVGKPMKILKES
jgi:hypothetical protein